MQCPWQVGLQKSACLGSCFGIGSHPSYFLTYIFWCSTLCSMSARKEVDVEDASDRAAKRRKSQLMRVPLRKITFWDNNRGGMKEKRL